VDGLCTGALSVGANRSLTVQQLNGKGKKNPSQRPGLEAYLLSHIKAPLREEKRGVASYPARNLSNIGTAHKQFPHAALGRSTQCTRRTSDHLVGLCQALGLRRC
jgi:hypothetical protein